MAWSRTPNSIVKREHTLANKRIRRQGPVEVEGHEVTSTLYFQSNPDTVTYMRGWCSLWCCGKACGSVCCTLHWNKEDLEHRGRSEVRAHRMQAPREGWAASTEKTYLWDASKTCPSSSDLEGQFLLEEKEVIILPERNIFFSCDLKRMLKNVAGNCISHSTLQYIKQIGCCIWQCEDW